MLELVILLYHQLAEIKIWDFWLNLTLMVIRFIIGGLDDSAGDSQVTGNNNY